MAAGATLAALLAIPAAAQVDWGDLFPDEAAAPAAKPAAKPAAPPPAPAAKPQPKVEAAAPAPAAKPRPKVEAAAPAPAKPQPREEVEEAAAPPPPRREAPVVAAEPPPAKPKKPAAVAEAPAPEQEEEAPPPKPRAVERVAAEEAPARAPKAAAPREQPQEEVQLARVVPRQAAPAAPGADGEPRLADLGLRDGEVVNDGNIDQYADYMSPGIEWGVRYGWKLKVQETRPVRPLRAYREATEKYSGQVRLGKDGLTLENYTAGQPFPRIDPNDPDVAKKIMWNFYYGWAYTDDIDIRLFDGDTGTIGKGRSMEVERHYIVDHLRRLYYNARLFVDPKPVYPNTEGYRFKESLHPLLEPFDLKGVGGTFYRYLDPNRQDDTWLYLPQLRRVRRLSTAQRSDALFGQDTDVDSYYGYNGHPAWNEYRFLGEKVVLATLHAKNVPVKWQEPENWFYDDYWEPRRVYVVEAASKLPQYAYSKRVIFIDKEAYVVPYSDIYDRAGQLWKIWVNMYSFRKDSVPGARVSVYDEEMAFGNAVVMMDMQLAHATRGALPSTKTRAEEGWFINMGEKSGTTEEFFTIAHLIETGH